jgi:hypothetical protein
VQPLAIAALSVFSVLTVTIFVLGRRFTRGYYDKHGSFPPSPWLFHDTGDPDLEPTRRFALLLLPIYLVAVVV